MTLDDIKGAAGRCLPLLFLACFCKCLYAQGGGPPMFTDDPGTPGDNHWEVITSIILQKTDHNEWNLPLLDVNYGLKERTQLKFEIPFQLSNVQAQSLKGKLGSLLLGLKFRFADEDKHFLSVSAYPQVSLVLHKEDRAEFKFPVELQKTIGRITLGEEIGYILINGGPDVLLNGNLIGISFSERLQGLAEIYFEKGVAVKRPANAFVNFGMRFTIKERVILLTALGTQVLMAEKQGRQILYAFGGIQWLF